MTNTTRPGLRPDERCNREGCDGELEQKPPENCCCHISPPCSSCVEAPVFCPKCGWTEGDDE